MNYPPVPSFETVKKDIKTDNTNPFADVASYIGHPEAQRDVYNDIAQDIRIARMLIRHTAELPLNETRELVAA